MKEPPAVDAYIGLGSNLADPRRQLASALAALAQLPNTQLHAVSSFYGSAPVGIAEQPDFVNAVAHLRTTLAPMALLERLLAIEASQGRVRAQRNGPRTLDLDLLAHGDTTCDEPRLTLPHPRMHERAFVLVPLAEIAPDFRLPGRGSAATLAASLGEAQRIEKLAAS